MIPPSHASQHKKALLVLSQPALAFASTLLGPTNTFAHYWNELGSFAEGVPIKFPLW